SESTLLFLLMCPFAFVLSLAAAAVLYRCVEEPFSMPRTKPKTLVPALETEREREPVSADAA
ncbi:MAG: hypothetical protein ACYTDU_12645, partial [Planctomycetota bacterium]